MGKPEEKFAIVPCSGIGKPFGSVSREAAYEVCEKLRPRDTQLVALSKLVMGDDEARSRVCKNRSITIDGCPKMCAAKMVAHSGGTIAREVTVFDAFRRYKDLKPEGIAVLNEAGVKLGCNIAGEIAELVDELRKPESEGGRGNA